jgi:hypothetical protein
VTQPVPPPALQSAPQFISRGDTLVFTIQVENPAPGSLPSNPPPPLVPTNITGWKFWFTAKRNFADPDSLAVAQVVSTGASTPPGGSIAITNALSGLVQVVGWQPSATQGFADAPEAVYYDVQAQDTLGNTFTVEQGTITVVPDVTRSTA